MLAPQARIFSVVRGYARVIDRHGKALGVRPLVLPTGDFFPDTFVGDEQSVQQLFERMKVHAGLGDLAASVTVVHAGEHSGESCGSSCGGGGGSGGSCGCDAGGAEPPQRLVRDESGWHLAVLGSETRLPEALTTHMARTLAVAFLAQAGGDGAARAPGASDLVAVALGFGALLLEGAHVYKKSCGGPSIARFTEIGLDELAIAVALFAGLGGHSLKRVQRELSPTQRDAVAHAGAWVDSNRDLVERLRRAPDRVAAGDFSLCETRPWLLRVLGRRGPARRPDGIDALAGDDGLEAFEAALAGSPVQRKAKAPDPKLDEIKQLVDEAFRNS
jgi:hypothetical protein